MSLVLNHNLMAANTARNLNAHYGRLATSTQRLSSGLRINTAADDAAGLAIRELQRADIAALHQGARNANDAVSMIQVADGALSIIDEKLIRMRELAEQAATGTYDSTQRLMIESEYQAMASEITRIANATDFNGIKLLDGTLKGDHDGSGLTASGQMKIHFGTGNDSAEDYYYVEIGECTSQAFGIGNASTWQDVQQRALAAFRTSLTAQIRNDSTLTGEEKTELLGQIKENVALLENALNHATDPTTAFLNFNADDAFQGNPALREKYMNAVAEAQKTYNGAPGWPTTSQEIMDKINGAIATVKDPDFTELYPDDFTNEYLPQVMAAAIAAGAEYGIPETAIRRIINANTDLANGNPQEPLDAKSLADWKQKIDAAMGADGAVPSWIANNVLDSIAGAIMDIKAPSNPPNDIDASIYSADYFGEFRAQVMVAAREAAKAKGIENTTALDNIISAIDPAPTGPGDSITAGDISRWQNALKRAIKDNNGTLRQDAITAGLNYIRDEIDAVDPGFNLVSENEFNTFTAAIRTSATNAAQETGMDLASLEKAIANATVPYDIQYADAEGIKSYRESLTKAIMGDNAVLKDAETAAELNGKVAEKNNEFWGGLRTSEQQKFMYSWGQSALDKLASGLANLGNYGLGSEKFTLGENLGDQIAVRMDAMLSNALKGMKTVVGHMDFAGFTIETQEDAQMALDAINAAIVSKDKIRAHIGAMQNRLENTITNLNVMAENLQAAESRISDVDIATEMTDMVRNQILAQAATAMLAQANSLPQMAMQLIGG